MRITYFLLLVLLLPSVHFAAEPIFDKNTINTLCKKITCHHQLIEYFNNHYFKKQFNKALVISYYKSGNRFVNDYFGVSSNIDINFQAKRFAMNSCKKQGRNCQNFLVNNRIENKDLYKKLTQNTNENSLSNNTSSNSSKNQIDASKFIGFSLEQTTKSKTTTDTAPSKCGYNYYKVGKSCLKVPSNGYSLSNSNYFYCNDGYKKIGSSCVNESNNYSFLNPDTSVNNYSNNRKQKTFFDTLINILDEIPEQLLLPFGIFSTIAFFTFFSGFKSRDGSVLHWLGLCLLFPFAIMAIALVRGVLGGF